MVVLNGRLCVWATYVFIGGCVWWVICATGLKTTALGREPNFANCVWAAWCCTVTASAHTHQINPIGRLLATTLTLGGLATYSMVTSTLSVTLRRGPSIHTTNTNSPE